MRSAPCHPDRPHKGKDLCDPCCAALRRAQNKPLSRNEVLRKKTPRLMSNPRKVKEDKG